MKPLTICIEQIGNDQKLFFHRFPLVLGRVVEADIRVADPWVSQLHCQFEWVEGTVLVRDLDSRNGTLVNGCPVSQSPVMPGDELLVGKTALHVRYQRRSLGPPPRVIYDASRDRDSANETEPAQTARELSPQRSPR